MVTMNKLLNDLTQYLTNIKALTDMIGLLEKAANKRLTANSTFAIGGVLFSADSFVVLSRPEISLHKTTYKHEKTRSLQICKTL